MLYPALAPLAIDYDEAVAFDPERGEFMRAWEPLPLPRGDINYRYHATRTAENNEIVRRVDIVRSDRNLLLAALKRHGLDPVSPLHWYVVDLRPQLGKHIRATFKVGMDFEAGFAAFRQEIIEDLLFNGVPQRDLAFESEFDWTSKFSGDHPILFIIRGTSGNLLMMRFKQWQPVRMDKYVRPNIGPTL